jgi:hypothetical protein
LPYAGFGAETARSDGLRANPEEATRKVKAIALQVLADMIESGEDVPDPLKVLFAA